MEEIIEILEKNNWKINTNIGSKEWEIENYSDLGEDLIEYINFDGTQKNFIEQFEEMVNSFDVDDHVELYINMRGKNGVPDCTIRELLNDAEGILKLYKNTLKELKGE